MNHQNHGGNSRRGVKGLLAEAECAMLLGRVLSVPYRKLRVCVVSRRVVWPNPSLRDCSKRFRAEWAVSEGAGASPL